MSKFYKVAIIGGGSAGILNAVELLSGDNCLNGEDVVILERNDRIGKKLISTGNGQGNLFNADFSSKYYHGESAFIDSFVRNANKIDVVNYFKSLGIYTTTLKDGKMYPISKQATSVLDLLRAFLLSKGCEIITGVTVNGVKKKGDAFTVFSDGMEIRVESVVLATGGKSQKQFGTDGTSYAIAQRLGHKLTDLYPSLVQVKTDLSKIKGLKGLKETAKVTAYDGNRELKSAFGEVLFTEYGVSGNAVFTVSGELASVKNPIIAIEFMPDFTRDEILTILTEREKAGYMTGELYLCGLINKRIGQAVCKASKSLSVKDVVSELKNFRLQVTGNLGFNYSQVTKGGIVTLDVDADTMESKLVENLYLIGEMLDIDGDCGGYNLTFAFVSGIVSAKRIKQKRQNNGRF